MSLPTSHCQNFTEEESLPEHLLTSEPFKDPYSTDEDDQKGTHRAPVNGQTYKKHGDITSKHTPGKQNHPTLQTNYVQSNTLQFDYVEKMFSAVYTTEGQGDTFMESQHLTVPACLEELLAFALLETCDRMKYDGKAKTFDGCSSREIVSNCIEINPSMKWLLENFNMDIKNIPEIAKTDAMRKILETANTPIQCKCETVEEKKKLIVEKRCSYFAQEFCRIMYLVEQGCEVDNIHGENCDKLKHVLHLLATIIDIPFWSSGQCESMVGVSEVGDNYRHEDRVLCDPDFVFISVDRELMVPVQVYVSHDRPTTNNEDKTSFRVQHVMDHIGLLRKKLIQKYNLNNQDPDYLNKPLVSVGLFLTKNHVHFTKVRTTIGHLSSSIKDLLPAKFRVDDENEAWARLEMRERRVENGLEVVKSNWRLDLTRGVHRNAFLLFLMEFIHGHDCPCVL